MRTIHVRTSIVCAGLALAATCFAAPLPPNDGLTEFSATDWAGEAQSATANLYDDTSRVQDGAASLRFETGGGFDTWLWTPIAKDAGWDLLAGGSGGLEFWLYSVNPNGSFQNGSPWIRLATTDDDYFLYTPAREIANDALGQWVQVHVPLGGDETWTVSMVGSPDFSEINFVEIHADTWGAGFTLWFDGMTFNVPIQPPQGLKALAGNHHVALTWQPYDDLTGGFDHYAIYRATATFDDVTGMTPIATLAGIDSTQYDDASAANGTSYYYAVTAVFGGGAETAEVEPLGPRTPRDETDLQVVSISRTPRFPRYDPQYQYYEITEPSGYGPYGFSAAVGLGSGQNASTQRWPNVGDTVTYTATIRNRGTNPWNAAATITWRWDGGVVQQTPVTLALDPDDTRTFTYQHAWDGELHDVTFELGVSDARPGNNQLGINSKSVAFLSYMDRSRVEEFREESASYPNPASDDFIDWLNRSAERFNEMFAAAGSAKRVHFDILEVLADDAPDPDVERIDFAIFPFRYYTGEGSLRWSGYYNPTEDIDFGLLHEMAHQLGLIDIYRLDLAPDNNYVSTMGYTAVADLMHGCSPFLCEHSADAMTHWLDVAHGYYGQYIYQMPEEVHMRFLGFDGRPLDGAVVKVYQKAERPGLGEVITTQIKAQGATDANGEFTLPNVPIDPALVPPTYAGDALHDNPFGYVAVVGTNGLLHFEVEHNGFVDYAWLDITEVNNAYWNGQTDVAVFDRTLSLGGTLQCYPPPDMAEDNAASWATWAQDGAVTPYDDTAFLHSGDASLRFEATGGFDNYVRYPGDQTAVWDLSDVQQIRFWCYAVNPNGGFQNGSPWVRLGNQDGYYEWHPTSDILNNAIGHWVEFVIPIAGNSTWSLSTFGAPSLDAINHFELHADTWGAGFTLWLDGIRFNPPLPPIPGDLDYDNVVNLADLAHLLGHYGMAGGATYSDGDLDGDGDVDLADLADLLGNYGDTCQ